MGDSVLKSGKIGAGKPGPGRPKGMVNKITASTKAALVAAFDELGGVESLVAWAKDNPGDFYRLWGRMVPQDVKLAGDPESPLVIQTWSFGGRKVEF
jgi:hypothetical protein